jgi:hypothetical protein
MPDRQLEWRRLDVTSGQAGRTGWRAVFMRASTHRVDVAWLPTELVERASIGGWTLPRIRPTRYTCALAGNGVRDRGVPIGSGAIAASPGSGPVRTCPFHAAARSARDHLTVRQREDHAPQSASLAGSDSDRQVTSVVVRSPPGQRPPRGVTRGPARCPYTPSPGQL